MKILAFDTSSAASSVALYRDGEVYAVHEPALVKQGTHLLPIIAKLLNEAALSLSELDLIAVGIGPGSFTGLRIGCSAAKAISVAKDIPIAPISSLHLLAQTAYQRHGAQHFLAAVDARKGEAYCGRYELNKALSVVQLVGEETLVNVTDSMAQINSSNTGTPHGITDSPMIMGIGDAWGNYYKHLLNYFQINTDVSLCIDDLPSASAMFSLVQHCVTEQQYIDAAQLVPHYLNDMSFSITS